MELDYSMIGKRIARRRKQLGLKQAEVEELAGIGDKYLSNIERAVSIPSIEVILRLAIALDTTPDEFLVGAVRHHKDAWQDVAELLRPMNENQLALAQSFLTWLGNKTLKNSRRPQGFPLRPAVLLLSGICHSSVVARLLRPVVRWRKGGRPMKQHWKKLLLSGAVVVMAAVLLWPIPLSLVGDR